MEGSVDTVRDYLLRRACSPVSVGVAVKAPLRYHKATGEEVILIKYNVICSSGEAWVGGLGNIGL